MNENSVSTKENSKIILAGLLSIVVFAIYYRYAFNMINDIDYQDIKDHAALAARIDWSTLKECWLERPYLMWHLTVKFLLSKTSIPYEHAVCFAYGIYALLCYWVQYWMIDKFCAYYKRNIGLSAAGISAALSFAGPLYMSWFNETVFNGQFGINPLYSPTHMGVKWVGLLAMAAAIDIVYSANDKPAVFFVTSEKNAKKADLIRHILYGVFLLISVFMKPTYAYAFLAGGALYILVVLIEKLIKKEKDISKVWTLTWKLVCASLPAVLYILLEYLAFYAWGGTNSDAKVALAAPFTAWHTATPSVKRSFVLALVFPIWVVLTDFKYFIKTIEGKFSLLFFLAGFLEFTFFIETGFKLTHLNFSWEYMSGMLGLYMIASIRLLINTYSSYEGKYASWNNVRNAVGWSLLFLHVYAGLYYINPFQYII